MNIDVPCVCGKVFKVPDERRGTKFKCYLCSREVHVPGAPLAASSATELQAHEQPDTQLTAENADDFIALHMAIGTPRRAIVELLQEKGVDRGTALAMISMPAHVRAGKAKAAPKVSIVIGSLFIAFGIGVAIDSLLAAAEGQGSYNLIGPVGCFLWGGYLLVRGLRRRKQI